MLQSHKGQLVHSCCYIFTAAAYLRLASPIKCINHCTDNVLNLTKKLTIQSNEKAPI